VFCVVHSVNLGAFVCRVQCSIRLWGGVCVLCAVHCVIVWR